MGEDAIAYAHDIKLEALRLLGTMLEATKRNTGAKGIGTSAVPKGNSTSPALPELGLDRKTSMLAQRVAKLSPEKFKDVQASVVVNNLMQLRRLIKRYSLQDHRALCLRLSRRGSTLALKIVQQVRQVGAALTEQNRKALGMNQRSARAQALAPPKFGVLDLGCLFLRQDYEVERGSYPSSSITLINSLYKGRAFMWP